jgi:hypothetical protein
MKLNLTLFYLLLLLLFSCKESLVTFEVPQPENSQILKEFPKRVMGTYYDLENNAELQIEKYIIRKLLFFQDTINVSQLDKNEIIVGDTLYILKTKEKFKITKINDTLFANYTLTDTIFQIGENGTLKKYKGNFFLNKKLENLEFWEVEMLSIKNGVLQLKGIKTENEIALLEEITETKKDTIKPFTVKPTKRQFKEFIKKNGFTDGETYIKK